MTLLTSVNHGTLEAQMLISEILRNKGSDVITVRPEHSVRELLTVMRDHNLGAAVVSADGHAIAGIVSERDVVRRLVDGPEVLDAVVSTIMTDAAGLHTCTAADTVDTLAQLMTKQRIRHVPVLDEDGVLAGIVSIGDVVKSRIGELQFERDELEHYVNS